TATDSRSLEQHLMTIGLGRGIRSDIPTGIQLGVTTTADHSTGIAQIPSSIDQQLAARFDARGAVDDIVTPAETAVPATRDRHRTVVEDVAKQADHLDLIARHNSAMTVPNIAHGHLLEATSLDQSPVAKLHGLNVDAGGTQYAAIALRTSRNQRKIGALNQRSVRRQPVVRLSEIQHRHQHLRTRYLAFFHPDDIVSQCGHLLR